MYHVVLDVVKYQWTKCAKFKTKIKDLRCVTRRFGNGL